MTDRNTEYEILVAQIHQGMLNFDGFENIRVEHDITITGKSGATHQVDVYWEFEAAGTTYRTCVECKNYKSAVKKTHVASFAEILRDIGNANGIIATTSSFQKGGVLLAKENNIRLVLVNHLIQSIQYKIQPIMSDFENIKINFNKESTKAALIRNGIEKFEIIYNYPGDHFLLNESGEKFIKFNEIINSGNLKDGPNILNCLGCYLDIKELGLIQLDSIEVDMVKRELLPIEGVIELPDSAKATIEDIVNKNVHYLHNDGTVSNLPNSR